jgi:hypothetical protein
LEQGAVLRAAGEYRESNAALDAAEDRINAYEQKAIRDQIKILIPLFLAGVRDVPTVGAAFPTLKYQQGNSAYQAAC